MQEVTAPLVSVVIPCYNGEKYIYDTIIALENQSYKNLQIILVNDGSTDNSETIIKSVKDPRIIYYSKTNSGVSDSRNKGLELSDGKYILFLDADDILKNDFVEKRIEILEANNTIGICSAKTIKIDENGEPMLGILRGVGENILTETLLYDQEISTCPSNYIIRKSILEQNNIRFNLNLYSSADRMFLIELSSYTKGRCIKEGAELLYRVHPQSMSNKLTQSLVKDNYQYVLELEKKKLVPAKYKNEFYFKNNYMICGSYFRLKQFDKSLLFGISMLFNSPLNFMRKITKMT